MPNRPSSNTWNSPQGPAPMIKTSVTMAGFGEISDKLKSLRGSWSARCQRARNDTAAPLPPNQNAPSYNCLGRHIVAVTAVSPRAYVVTKLNVNGKSVEVDVDPETPLLWVLRDTLGLTGTKFGCGMALCGGCTVHVNGQATRACVTPVSAVAGKRINTIEGLPATPVTRAVKKAWVDLDVVQCGYCQPGQVMAATALLGANAKPSDADIDAAMSGNICRCGT